MNRAKILTQLWRILWLDYSRRVEYARIYQQMIEAAGGEVANDHIAFRSLRLTVDTPSGVVNLGIPYLANIIEALGYTAAGEYKFPDQALYARHYRHPEQDRFDLPKIFISELIVDALPSAIAQLITQTVSSGQFYNWKSVQDQIEDFANEATNPQSPGGYGEHTDHLIPSLSEGSPLTPLEKGGDKIKVPLQKGDLGGSNNLSQPVPRSVHTPSPEEKPGVRNSHPQHSPSTAESLLDQLQLIFTRPWQPPKQSVVETVNTVSQYGAWVLLHGYAVNHFTGYINRQQTPLYPDIESTAKGLAERGIPMKADIEGDRGSGLRQTATRAVMERVTVQDDKSGNLIQIPWTYAYYEIAERNPIEVDAGHAELFEGFLGPQARNLFKMTHKLGS